jgi:sugar phosphate isomerase/epimerase
MNCDIREYARLGLVHHMLYPECTFDPDNHTETLIEFLKRDDIETFDCCLPYGEERRQKLIPLIRESNKKDITFAIHLFPLRKLALTDPSLIQQAQIKMLIKDMIEQAVQIGATGFIFASGGPSPENATEADYCAFINLCKWLCRELKPHGIIAMLEPFDTKIDKKFLFGPTEKCVSLIRDLEPEIDNFGIELDVAHLPLMGESFEHAIKTTAPYLKRIHLGNCVLKDKSHPRYGDTHPPAGYPGGEIDIHEMTEILRLLLDVGFLDKDNRGNMVIEMTPWPGKTVEETITDGFDRLEKAWHLV